MTKKTQEELIAADVGHLKYPSEIYIAPDGSCRHSSWWGGVRYIRSDIVAAKEVADD